MTLVLFGLTVEIAGVNCRQIEGPNAGSDLCGHRWTAPKWQVHHASGGGIFGSWFTQALSSDGALRFDDKGWIGGHDHPATACLSPEEMAEFDALLEEFRHGEHLKAQPPPPDLGCCDSVYTATKITYADRGDSWLSGSSDVEVRRQQDRFYGLLNEAVNRERRKIDERAFRAGDHFRLGMVWLVEERIINPATRLPATISSIWTRRGESDTFDSVWHNRMTGEHGTDAVRVLATTMRDAQSGTIVLDASEAVRRYTGHYELRSDHHVSGTAFGGFSWNADIFDSPLTAAVAAAVCPDCSLPSPPSAQLAPPVKAPELVGASPSTDPQAFDVEPLTDAVAVATGGNAACALRAEGSVVCWASQAYDPRLGEYPGVAPYVPRPVRFPSAKPPPTITDITMGYDFAMALAQDHSVWLWGSAEVLTPGICPTEDAVWRMPRKLTRADGSLLSAVAMSAGGQYACVVTESGEVLCFGTLSAPYGSRVEHAPGLARRLNTRSASIRVGGSLACAMDEVGPSCWGSNWQGALASSDPDTTVTEDVAARLVRSGAERPFRNLTVGAHHACVVDVQSAVWCWGDNAGGALGLRAFGSMGSPKPVRLTTLPLESLAELFAGDEETCMLADGRAGHRLFCVGHADPRNQPSRYPTQVDTVTTASGAHLQGILQVALSESSKCAVVASPGAISHSGQVWCWGTPIRDRKPDLCPASLFPKALCMKAAPVGLR